MPFAFATEDTTARPLCGEQSHHATSLRQKACGTAIDEGHGWQSKVVSPNGWLTMESINPLVCGHRVAFAGRFLVLR
jgi:hypothetical protein